MNKKSTILIADDHSILRAGLRSILDNHPDFKVIAEADNGKDALQKSIMLEPDLLLTDLSMPKTNGTECIRELKKRAPKVKVLVLTMHAGEEHIHAAINAGADGYVLKDDSHDELIKAIKNILNGKTHLSPSICNNTTNDYLNSSKTKQPTASWEILTHREREVIKLIAEGYRSKDIADYLTISVKTVEKHRSNLMKKLDLHSVSSLTNYATQHGLANQD